LIVIERVGVFVVPSPPLFERRDAARKASAAADCRFIRARALQEKRRAVLLCFSSLTH
jgi:hypothetical protein